MATSLQVFSEHLCKQLFEPKGQSRFVFPEKVMLLSSLSLACWRQHPKNLVEDLLQCVTRSHRDADMEGRAQTKMKTKVSVCVSLSISLSLCNRQMLHTTQAHAHTLAHEVVGINLRMCLQAEHPDAYTDIHACIRTQTWTY